MNLAPEPDATALLGGGQATWRETPAPEPLDMWEQVARAAADDTGAPAADVLDLIDDVQVVYCQSWPYDDPAGRLAERLGLGDGHRLYSGIGGTTPQELVADTARRIADGDTRLALIVAGEALATKRALKKAGERPAWSHRAPEPPPFPFPYELPATEISHEVFQAYLTFALFDSARRGRLGRDPAEHRRAIGELLAPMTEVAAANPHAWFPDAHTPDELTTPTDDNRMVASPYTKRTVAVMHVDMAGAVLVGSAEVADELGIDPDRRGYLRGHAAGRDPWAVAARHDLSRSSGMRHVFTAALDAAEATPWDVEHFELYSCFASSLAFALDALGIEEPDAPRLTVTGGLPYFGGPGSGYLVNALAQMLHVLRDDPGSLGLVTGVGMHLSKHAAGVYSTTPGPLRFPSVSRLQRAIDQDGPPRRLVDQVDGTATIAACSVLHERDGSIDKAVAVLELDDGTRAYAHLREGDLLAEAEQRELVGTSVKVRHDDGVNVIVG